ncbi:hypothetical protein K439DRAFT_1334031 [Ramaria rubella]|nr:hypothetical protein K439DRAFT_1334031 [Ramaria rubella]
MPNPSGANGSSNGDHEFNTFWLLIITLSRCIWIAGPPEEELQTALLEYAKEHLPLELCANEIIRKTKLKQLNKEFNIPSARKSKMPFNEINQLVIEKVSHDVQGTNGPESIHTKIALDGFILTRYTPKVLLQLHVVEIFILEKSDSRSCCWNTTFHINM